MAVFKCKMCGGSLNVQDHSRIVECEYCGTRQTLPKLENEKTSGLFDRAGDLRRQNEFDKAEALYEQILEMDNTDAEVYWSLVLCKYGIEYVEEPGTGKRIPTIHRAQFTSIFADENFKKALEYADDEQRQLYNEEAGKIEQIQKDIIEISSKEEPFDVFICYKESDENGNRTEDSVIAYDLYQNLTKNGYKVFFSRVTLESKLGTAYEPYIFSALNSAKVMIVIGTKPEYFNAVWVKNEWSRFLKMMKEDKSKTLIPAYKNMNPYALPKEFSYLQAQDMSKLGFLQDITHGIDKILESNKETEQAENDSVKPTDKIKKLSKKNKIIISIIASVLVVAIIVGSVVIPKVKTSRENTPKDNNTASDNVQNQATEQSSPTILDESTQNAIVKAYVKQLEEAVTFYGVVSEYTIYDIDNNGIPDLIYRGGDYPGGGLGYFCFYTYTDKIEEMKSLSASHASLAIPLSGSGLILLRGHRGYCYVSRITYSKDVGFTEKELINYEISADQNYDDYFRAYAGTYLYTLEQIDEPAISELVKLGYNKYLDSIGVTPKKVGSTESYEESETYVEMNDYTDAEVNNYSEEPVDYGYNDTQADTGFSEIEIDSNKFTLAGR